MRDAVFLRGLRRGQFVVPIELQLPVGRQREDGVGAPLRRIRRSAPCQPSAAPLVREDDATAIIVERGRMPIGEVRVTDFGEALGFGRVADVDQDPIARACAQLLDRERGRP